MISFNVKQERTDFRGSSKTTVKPANQYSQNITMQKSITMPAERHLRIKLRCSSCKFLMPSQFERETAKSFTARTLGTAAVRKFCRIVEWCTVLYNVNIFWKGFLSRNVVMRNCLIEMRIPSTKTSSHSLEVSDTYLWMVVVMVLSSFLGVNLGAYVYCAPGAPISIVN